MENCPNLNVEGVMTIGRFGHDYSTGPNPDFEELIKCHQAVCETFNLDTKTVHMSMGMSDDFQEAVSRPEQMQFIPLNKNQPITINGIPQPQRSSFQMYISLLTFILIREIEILFARCHSQFTSPTDAFPLLIARICECHIILKIFSV